MHPDIQLLVVYTVHSPHIEGNHHFIICLPKSSQSVYHMLNMSWHLINHTCTKTFHKRALQGWPKAQTIQTMNGKAQGLMYFTILLFTLYFVSPNTKGCDRFIKYIKEHIVVHIHTNITHSHTMTLSKSWTVGDMWVRYIGTKPLLVVSKSVMWFSPKKGT